MKTKDFLIALFGSTLNQPPEKVASLFTNEEGTEVADTALDEYKQLDITKVEGFKAKEQEAFKNGQAKITKELMTDFEKKLKEKYAVNSDKKGDELIDEIVTLKTGDKTTIEENKVKSHPAYIALQDANTKKLNEVESAWKEKYETFEKGVAKKTTLSKVIDKALPHLDGYGLPEDATIRANQLDFFKQKIEAYEYEPHENDFIIKNAAGEVVADKHGNRLTHEKLVHEIAASYWPKKEGQGRSGAGASNNPQGQGQATTGYKGIVPKTESEYSKALVTCKTSEERIALTDAYKAEQAKGG